jgi:hypothetical protein
MAGCSNCSGESIRAEELDVVVSDAGDRRVIMSSIDGRLIELRKGEIVSIPFADFAAFEKYFEK